MWFADWLPSHRCFRLRKPRRLRHEVLELSLCSPKEGGDLCTRQKRKVERNTEEKSGKKYRREKWKEMQRRKVERDTNMRGVLIGAGLATPETTPWPHQHHTKDKRFCAIKAELAGDSTPSRPILLAIQSQQHQQHYPGPVNSNGSTNANLIEQRSNKSRPAPPKKTR